MNNNNPYHIVSYFSDERGFEKTSLIYDTINERIIEKWISYQLIKNESKFVITDRFIYVYNKFNVIYRIIEIKTGVNHRKYIDNNEYCHSFNRYVNYLESDNETITEVVYRRNNNIGSKLNNDTFIKSLNLLSKKDINNVWRTRLNYVIENRRLYVYQYKKDDFFFLEKIIEYKLLMDLRFINRLLSFTGIPILKFIPDFFLKSKIDQDFVNDNEIKRLFDKEQDYLVRSFMDQEEIYIHNLIFKQDSFVREKYDILKKYDTLV